MWCCENCRFEAVKDLDFICKECKQGFNNFVPKHKSSLENKGLEENK